MDTVTNSSLGLKRFNHFLQPLQAALDKAEASDNPALTLYEQKIRTPLFMLEALTRLYRPMINKKLFEKLYQRFKLFEDLLGGIDYYDAFDKEFSTKEKIPSTCKEFIKKQMEKKISDLHQMLVDGNWIGRDNKRMRKIISKLEKAAWPAAKEDADGIRAYYSKSIDKIAKNPAESKMKFHDVEKDVHELRRDLRWLSIYPQALLGLIQMKPTVNSPEYLGKYLVPEILNSPFNKMREPGDLKNIIFVNADYFYALSWIIAELGNLKDNGLRIEVLKEALHATEKLSVEDAAKKALALCGEGQMTTGEILKRAKDICEQFFNEKIPEQILCN